MSDTWIVPDEGKIQILQLVFGLVSNGEDLRLDQFIGGGPVTDSSTLGDFTFASYTGHAPVVFSPGDWNTPAIAAHIGSITKTTDPVFTCTGGSPQTVNGLIISGSDSDIIYFGCNYTTPVVMSSGTSDTISPLKVQDKTFA